MHTPLGNTATQRHLSSEKYLGMGSKRVGARHNGQTSCETEFSGANEERGETNSSAQLITSTIGNHNRLIHHPVLSCRTDGRVSEYIMLYCTTSRGMIVIILGGVHMPYTRLQDKLC